MLSVYSRNLRNQSLRTLSSLLLNQRIDAITRSSFAASSMPGISNVVTMPNCESPPLAKMWSCFDGARRFSSKSMRSKVEKRMQRESGKTLREVRRAKKLRKKLMTDEERLIYNLRRAKKKVALLLQKLKKYELPELPPPRHDPELLTAEQLQAIKKIGFRNKNYCPVGIRGVFGGVVQNMHLHWKFHETVQVCCDNFPKEKIKEMASLLTRLSGGIVVNIHNVKTIIMFRGRNYRQPKNLIPINTLTKRKALFKARFEQALESQKLNIKKIEQDLRRKGVNPDDPVAMASIQRVASTFFNAIDKREGSPYVFREDKATQAEAQGPQQLQDAGEDSDQEELDRFIAEIEDAADKEWEEEESAEKEEISRIRYWNREDFGSRYQRYEGSRNEGSGDETGDRMRYRNQRQRRKSSDNEVEGEDDSDSIGEVVRGSYADDSDEAPDRSNVERHQRSKTVRANSRGFGRNEIKSNDMRRNFDSEVLGEDGFDSDGIEEVVRGSYVDDSDEAPDKPNAERCQRSKNVRANSRGVGRNEIKSIDRRSFDSEVKGEDGFDSDGIGEVVHGSYVDESDEALDISKVERRQRSKTVRANSRSFGRNVIKSNDRRKKNTVSELVLSDLEDVALDSEGERRELRNPGASNFDYVSSSDDDSFEQLEKHKGSNNNANRGSRRGASAKLEDGAFAEDDLFSESEIAKWESDATSGEDDDNDSK